MSALATFAAALLCANGVAGYANYPTIPKDLSTPVQQRLAFHATDAVSVGWNTYEKLAKPCVKYGTSKTDLSKESCSTSSITYNTSRTWSNYVTLKSLTPGTTYYCRSFVSSANGPEADPLCRQDRLGQLDHRVVQVRPEAGRQDAL